MKVGIPRALLWWEYKDLWQDFFKKINIKILLSPSTNKQIAKVGSEKLVDDLCFPLKIYVGHVWTFINTNVDWLFIPYIISTQKQTYMCPIFSAVADIMRVTFEGLPKILSPVVNLKKNKGFEDAFVEIAKIFERKPCKIKINKNEKEIFLKDTKSKKIALVGHPYNIFDEYFNKNLKNKIEERGFEVIFTNKKPKKNYTYWTLANWIIEGALWAMENKTIDGLIYPVAFGCCVDSLIQEMIYFEAKKRSFPYLCLVFDEHTQEVSVATRIEAFLDTIR